MPLNLPLPRVGEGFESGLKTGSDFLTAMQERQRKAEILPYLLQKYKDEHLQSQMQTDPKTALNYITEMMSGLQQMRGGQGGAPDRALMRAALKKMGWDIPEESASEKRKADIRKELDISSGKEAQKEMKDAKDTAEIVNRYAHNVEKLHTILNKYPHTSPLLPSMAAMSPNEWGEFDEAATPLIGKLGKEISQRGGAVAAGFAKAGKPSKGKFHGQNLGLTKGLINTALSDYREAKQKYERASGGEPFPVKLDPFYEKFDTVKVKRDGKEYNIPRSMLPDALKEGATVAD